jgi:tRNA(Ile)-lysidine synthase
MNKNNHSKQLLFEKIALFVEKNNLINSQQTIIVGFSGGPDSRFLLEWLLWYTKDPNRIIAAHLNHQWRPDADREEKQCFVTTQKLGIPFIAKKISEYQESIAYNGSQEAFARLARRMFLEKIAQENNGIIALGHHQDDQIETFFIRLARGTTGTGLAGMQPKNGLYIRPLLETTKDAILAELDQLNIQYCVDSSNQSKNYLRNDIRLSLIPILHTIDHRFKNNIIQTMHHLQSAEQSLAIQINRIIEMIGFEKNGVYCINKIDFLKLDLYMQKRVLIELLIQAKNEIVIHNNLLKEIIRFLSNNGSRHCFSKKLSIHQTKELFWITSLQR